MSAPPRSLQQSRATPSAGRVTASGDINSVHATARKHHRRCGERHASMPMEQYVSNAVGPSRTKITLAEGAGLAAGSPGRRASARMIMSAGAAAAAALARPRNVTTYSAPQHHMATGCTCGTARARTISSSSTGASSGSTATPTALRACRPASPKTSRSSWLAPLPTSGWPVKSGALATKPAP